MTPSLKTLRLLLVPVALADAEQIFLCPGDSQQNLSDALVHKRNKVTRPLEQFAPFLVITRSRLSCDNFC
jgi:hypothetical protein